MEGVFFRSRSRSVSVGMKMFLPLLANMGEDSVTPCVLKTFWTKQKTIIVRVYSSALHHTLQIVRHASLSAELCVNITVTLSICCYDSANDCHKSVAVSGILSVCGA